MKLISRLIVIGIFTIGVPITSLAQTTSMFFLNSIFTTIFEITKLDPLLLLKNTPINNHQKTVFKNQIATPKEEIIDTYSGIKISFTDNHVFFSYLGENNPPILLRNATPNNFELLETGTQIIAKDAKSVFIIYGTEQIQYTNFDLSSLKTIRTDFETLYIKDKNNTYLIDGKTLIPINEIPAPPEPDWFHQPIAE